MPPAAYDVFLTYADADAAWVERLAVALADAGRRVFLDVWEIRPGTVRVHERERGLENARDGIVVVSPASMAEPWVHLDYAVLLKKAIAAGRLLVPVLLADAEMPALLSTYQPVDFRGPAGEPGPLFDQRLDALIRALEGRAPARGLVLEPGTGYKAGGTLYRRLELDRRTATLHGGDDIVTGSAPGLDPATEERLWQLWRSFRSRGENLLRDESADTTPANAVRAAAARLHQRQLDAGQALGRAFLPAEVVGALGGVLDAARRSGSTLELALEIDGELAHLPWETLVLPGATEPLALDPAIHLYRAIAGSGAATAWTIPGPLRILVAIGSPEAQNPRGELLDMERELALVLDAVEPARRHGRAWVKVIERGTVRAIREALEAERYHVLHLSCHAGPGVLILEDDEGSEDKVTTERLCRDAIPSGRGVPLVVLAGCSTALDDPAGDEKADDERRLRPGLARGLLEHGVPAVVAMQAPVGDRYATQLVSSIYAILATVERPEPLRALARARRQVEELRRRDDDATDLAEWSVPVLFLRRPERGTAADLPLYDPRAPAGDIRRPADATFAPGVVARQVGEFVGRRRDQRHLLRLLRAPDGGAVVVRGLGGAGKSTLAAELARTLARDGWTVVSVVGETVPEDVLEAIGSKLLSDATAQGLDERHPMRRISAALRRRDADWSDRLRLLTDHVLGELPLLLLLDNFEDNLTADATAFRNDDLGAFLHGWIEQPGRSRLLVTCRRPVPWDDGAAAVDWHLGPLSFAETRKLIWRLVGLDALTPEEKHRAWTDVGGHPRALEYLDALLRGGEARFPDVAKRMEAALRAQGIEDPKSWLVEKEGGLDKALAEAVTLAIDDVLLGRLLDGLADMPLGGRLLLGASIYRVPVEETGLVWQVGEIPSDLPANFGVEFPDVAAPPDFVAARKALEATGLLAPFALTDDGGRRYAVHRWTAEALASRAGEEERKEAHRRAASYWRWRVRAVSHDLEEHLEARFHHRRAGMLDQVVLVTLSACRQLRIWGAYRRVEQLCREVLTWVPKRSEEEADLIHHLGIIALKRGSYDEALRCFRENLQIKKGLGNRDGMAAAYHHLGFVAQERGSYNEALDWFQKALQIFEELEDCNGMASEYHHLGIVNQRHGSYNEASEWLHKALPMFEEVGNRRGMGSSYHHLGINAQSYESYNEAVDLYWKSFQNFDELGDRSEMATVLHQLGVVAALRNSYQEALDWTRKALQIKEELGDRVGTAGCHHQLGLVLTRLKKPAEGIHYTLQSLTIHLETQSPSVLANLNVLTDQRELLGEERFRGLVAEHAGEGSVKTVLELIAQVEAAEDSSSSPD